DLFHARDERDVGKAALDFRPFVTRLTSEPACVLLESLMEDSDNDQSAAGTCRRLCEFLEKINIAALGCGAFEELAHLVDDEHYALAWTALRFVIQTINQIPAGGY